LFAAFDFSAKAFTVLMFWSYAVFLRLSTGISSFFASVVLRPAFLSSSWLKPFPLRVLPPGLVTLGFI
jgi:hypothetical protein